MKGDQQDIMVFIDLGFILLVGFLILTDTTPIENVALPAADESEVPVPEEDRTVYEVTFDSEHRFVVLLVNQKAEVCSFTGLEALIGCMAVLSSRSDSSVFVLNPQGRATVQQMVTILDECTARNWSCTVRS